MAQVSAPYNFVPLNEKVFFPPWAHLVNHDVPFENGLSGQIKLEITAETPIFIRKPYEDGDDYYETKKDGKTIRISKEFSHFKIKDKDGNIINKRYYIPGSSIKNMLRSIVEIIGFGKLNPDEFIKEIEVKKESFEIKKYVKNIQLKYSSLNYDLPQIMFGSINNIKLKGRIHINHAFFNNVKVNKEEYKIVLASPKASYYPFYLEQKINNNTKYKIEGKYNTYHNSFVKIRGRKRYPLHPLNLPNKQEQQKLRNNVATYIEPLLEGTIFETKISFHNLLPTELGALLSAITFHNNTNCRHNIGAAKAFGLGQISLKPTVLSLKSNNNQVVNKDIIYYLKEFENSISQKISNWSNSLQLRELFTMSSISAKENFNNFKYMNLPEFQKIINEKKALPLFSEMIDYRENITSLISENKLNLSNKEELSHLLTAINNKINSLKEVKYNTKQEYELNEGDYLGTVKFFNEEKGFGFIKEKVTGDDYFVHKKSLFDTIKKNDIVIFNIVPGRKKGEKAADRVEIFDKNNNKHIKQ